MKKLVFLSFMAVVIAVTGCNTFKGMGKDIEGAGQAIQKASDKTKEGIKK